MDLRPGTLLMLHHNLRSYRHAAIEVYHIVIDESEAARRHRLSDRLRRIGTVNTVNSRADVHRTRTERIARAAGHPARQIRLACDHLWRRHPIRPFALKRNIVDAAPLKSIAADADAVTHSDAIAHDEVQKAVVSVDDDRARRLFGAVVHGLAPQFGCQIAIAPSVVDS